MKSTHILTLLISAAAATICGGCFTGIESTPRITGNDVRLAGALGSPEQALTATVVPEAPSSWNTGKRWLVADSRISMIFTAASTGDTPDKGDEITLAETHRIPTFSGKEGIELRFSGPDGASLYYRPEISADDWNDSPSLAIPFTVELSAVAIADSLMRGNTYYITTPMWYDRDGHPVEGLRHVPVTIDSVIPGNERYPLCVAFTPPAPLGDRPRYILMTYGTASWATRNFDRLFAFDNPRKSYPRITDSTWNNIIHSRIQEGMTRDECRLALGAPISTDRGATRGFQMERWSYDNGIYLLFEDGILIRFRK